MYVSRKSSFQAAQLLVLHGKMERRLHFLFFPACPSPLLCRSYGRRTMTPARASSTGNCDGKKGLIPRNWCCSPFAQVLTTSPLLFSEHSSRFPLLSFPTTPPRIVESLRATAFLFFFFLLLVFLG
jgi:hypothetical protein